MLGLFILNENDPDDDYVNEVTNGRIEIQRGYHVHYRQKISLNVAVLMKSHHRRICDYECLDVTWPTDRSLGTLPPLCWMMFLSTSTLNLNQTGLRLPLETSLRQSSWFTGAAVSLLFLLLFAPASGCSSWQAGANLTPSFLGCPPENEVRTSTFTIAGRRYVADPRAFILLGSCYPSLFLVLIFFYPSSSSLVSV